MYGGRLPETVVTGLEPENNWLANTGLFCFVLIYELLAAPRIFRDIRKKGSILFLIKTKDRK
jgi:hypothetical protein